MASDDKAIRTVVLNHIVATILLSILQSSDTSPTKNDKFYSVIDRGLSPDISKNCDIRKLKLDFGKLASLDAVIGTLSTYSNLPKFDEAICMHRQDCPFGFDDFSKALELAMLYEGCVSSQRIQEYSASLQVRLEALRQSEIGNLFCKTQYKTKEDCMNSYLLDYQVLLVDISSLDDSVGQVVVNVFAKLLFDFYRKNANRASKPINFIVDEAHRYIRMTDELYDFNIFERIAKEGRKFGISLGVSSQRPSELSKTVLSQCSNFVIHRIQNPDDLNYICRMVPYINSNILSRLSYLQTGTALVFGTAIRMPQIVRFELASPLTYSQNAAISKAWYIPANKEIKQS